MAIYMRREWNPGANTIAYFPFKDNKNNTISGGPSISSSNIGITTLNGVKCLEFDGTSTQALSIGHRVADITSAMCWVKGVNDGFILSERKTGSGFDQARHLVLSNGHIVYNRYQQALADIDYNAGLGNGRHCIGYTEDSSGAKIFLDGNQAAVATNGTTRTFVNLTDNVGFGCTVNNTVFESPTTGYISKLVLLNDSITVSDFLDFYYGTKGDYYKLPSEYQKVEYIQSSGTQWINTTHTHTDNSKVEIKFNYQSTNHEWDLLFGSRSVYTANDPFCLYVHNNSYIGYNIGGLDGPNFYASTSNTDYVVSLSKNNIIINGNSTALNSNLTSYNYEDRLFNFGQSGSQISGCNPISAKVYYCKIWESDTLVRDFIPCYRKSDGVIGMYDLINEQFYTNAGTGTFTKGDDIS